VNLPNAITLTRLLLTVFFIIGASIGGFGGILAALICFTIASLTDWLDGYLARKMNLVTDMGKLLDPLADKILVCSAFVMLTKLGIAPAWVTCAILSREFLVTGIRQLAVEKGVVIAADKLGKWKTVFQITFCISGFVWLTLAQTNSQNALASLFRKLSDPEILSITMPAMWIAAALTIISGVNYFRASIKLFS